MGETTVDDEILTLDNARDQLGKMTKRGMIDYSFCRSYVLGIQGRGLTCGEQLTLIRELRSANSRLTERAIEYLDRQIAALADNT